MSVAPATDEPPLTFILNDGETVSGMIEGLWFRMSAATWGAAVSEASRRVTAPTAKPWQGVRWIEHARKPASKIAS